MKEKRSKRPQKWHLGQSQLFHTEVKKQPPMADTLSFNWKRSVRMSGWVFSSVTENSFSPNFASLPSLQTRTQIFLTDPERPQPSSAGVSGLVGPTQGKEGRRPSLGLGSGLRKLRRERTAFARTRGHRTHSTHSHDLRHGFQQRRLTFWPSLPSASLPGRDFLSIIDRRPAVELVGGSHRKVSLAGHALCSLKGIQRGALSCPLVSFFFFFREASVCADALAFWHYYHLKLFRFLFSLAPPPASCGHDDRPAGLSGVEARGASARVRWVNFRLGWGRARGATSYVLETCLVRSHGITAVQGHEVLGVKELISLLLPEFVLSVALCLWWSKR